MKSRAVFTVAGLATLILLGTLFVSVFGARQEARFVVLENLPRDIVYIKHPYEEEQAEETGKILMRHYGTPEAVEQGGPIYGAMGYRIVSIEYEISVNAIPEKTVGQTFPGYLLELEESGFPYLDYDHFHISYQQGGHLYDKTINTSFREHKNNEDENGSGVYSIHFMLIPHTEELRYGLVCE